MNHIVPSRWCSLVISEKYVHSESVFSKLDGLEVISLNMPLVLLDIMHEAYIDKPTTGMSNP